MKRNVEVGVNKPHYVFRCDEWLKCFWRWYGIYYFIDRGLPIGRVPAPIKPKNPPPLKQL